MTTGGVVAIWGARGAGTGLEPETGEGPIGVTGLFVGERTATGT
jgi:hypothetical protein